MHLIYLAARLYPYWAFAIAIVLVQIAFYFRRRNRPAQFPIFGGAGFLLFGILVWFATRGDLHSDDWIRALFGDY